ncbi:LLM class flavin-dependent oxidoreductase [Xenorhabdus bovienii]|uniref:LLM class flavin-dependent oxidoreductase n=1 Tax=Xenorhabdus bovienii TaxID=40576 RepID=A0AAJ1J502_XENBV|nr:MupA/Atu3671 family FMN-dependent luciferase-like monooxygenase [Xenorhabdus bovienii]MDE1476886.1 LLM class flavin-dependent oxidoreductase [Xenorhabdus bovienii]MDE1485099.1 LLM class flavin-dependent oxidoreductase [Xenorhabdus bovienii]MDE1494194.1 LLM class flavin-dependent oxidoreductase [Xenorhabdus bovienii]MDE9430273.1 LLM class flavin-dependent oxidoreductase [Xenorhabdus bovienii]MDE9444924.1 LLM class flavin-dependent oxidoreductase [Xenorhabdus bovienii]
MNKSLTRRIETLSEAKKRILEAKMWEQEGKNGQLTESKKNVVITDNNPEHPMDFSLFFFAQESENVPDSKYDFLLQAAQYADQHDFHAVWTPERHYKDFGGLYPNPSVLSAALAAITCKIQIRAGSVVLPLHSPERVAEEWSVVDNLSGGRVGIAIASGWNPDDFATHPALFNQRRTLLMEKLTTVQQLWRGESFSTSAGKSLRIYPSPLQKELPVWLTSLSEDSFVTAGRLGLNILTGMMEHDIDGLTQKIVLYRKARENHGHNPATGKVTVMLHTYIGDNDDDVKTLVKAPMMRYLHAFVAAGEAKIIGDNRFDTAYHHEQAGDRDALLNYTFERYFATRALMGTQESCKNMVINMKNIGVNEIACLLDFGLESQTIFAGIKKLNMLREMFSLRHTHRRV